jgi:CRP-like cAMP-binding protein
MDERQHILTGLSGLADVDEAVLIALSRRFDFRTYEGLDLCGQGERSDRFWILGRGQISVTRRLSQRRLCEIARIGPTAMVGYAGLMGIVTRSATLKAEGTVEVLEMSTDEGLSLLAADGDPAASAFRRAIIAAVSRQVAMANTNIGKLAVEVGLAEQPITEERLLKAHTLL